MSTTFRKIEFEGVDGQIYSWDLSYICDATNGTVYTFLLDTAITSALSTFRIPIIDNQQLKTLPYDTFKQDIYNLLATDQSVISGVIVNGVAQTAENANKTSFSNNEFAKITYSQSTNSFSVNNANLPGNPYYGMQNFQLLFAQDNDTYGIHLRVNLGVLSIGNDNYENTTPLFSIYTTASSTTTKKQVELHYTVVQSQYSIIEFTLWEFDAQTGNYTVSTLDSNHSLYIKRIN